MKKTITFLTILFYLTSLTYTPKDKLSHILRLNLRLIKKLNYNTKHLSHITQSTIYNCNTNKNYKNLNSNTPCTSLSQFPTINSCPTCNSKNLINVDSVLHYGIETNNYNLVYLALKTGANINSIDYYKQTPLIKCVNMRHVNLLNYLLEHGANANCEDLFKQTALMKAIKLGNLSFVKILLEHNAAVNTQDNQEKTPLIHAKELENLEIKTDMLKILLQHGAK